MNRKSAQYLLRSLSGHLFWVARYLKARRVAAPLRYLWWACVRRYVYEKCESCGRGYPMWWCFNQSLYDSVTKDPDSVLCIDCFNRMAEKNGVAIVWCPVTHQEWGEKMRSQHA